MKFLSLTLIAILLIIGGCAEGGGDPAPVQSVETQSTPTPAKTPETSKTPTPPESPTPTPSPDPTPVPVPAPKPQLNWKATGTIRDGGAWTATFKYDPTAVARATNVHNLSPNSEFAFTDWKVVIDATENHPEVVFDPSNSTQEFCVGSCIFSVSSASEKITWTNGVDTFYIAFPLPPTVMTFRYPLTNTDWGPIDLFASGLEHRYGSGRFEFTLQLLATGTIQQVQEAT